MVTEHRMKAPEMIVMDRPPAVKEIHVIWMTTGLSCDGDSVSITAASQPSIEDLVMGNIPGLPKVHVHNPVIAYETGDDFMKWWFDAAAGKLDPFVLVMEGSIPNEKIKAKGTGRRWELIPTPANRSRRTSGSIASRPSVWGLSLAGRARPTAESTRWRAIPQAQWGCADYLGWDWRSKAGLPVVNVPGCPVQPDNMMETLLYLLYQVAGLAPLIPLDDQLRPTWLFGKTVHEGCDRAGYYEQADFAKEYGSPKCLVKIGCWGPVVNCNVTKRGWMAGIGGCPNVGGICIGCTMPGFPDKFMPFMDAPPGSALSTKVVGVWGGVLRALRAHTNNTVNKEPKWRHRAWRTHDGIQTKTLRPQRPQLNPPEKTYA